MNIILPILLFGMLVFIHELGHFTVAKLSGVFVERFALGFGPAILRKKWGETEYAICLLPLGGYVKMRGEDLDNKGEATPTSDPRSFANKPVWTRIAIVAMGPIANLLLPFTIFMIFYMIGMNTPTAHIGSLVPGYPAEKAGLRPGDKILSIDEKPVDTWNQLTQALGKRAGLATKLKVERENELLTISVTPISEKSANIYGEQQESGKIGVDPLPNLPVVGIMTEEAKAKTLGFKTGDVLSKINGTPTRFWWQVEKAMAAEGEKKVSVLRFEGEKETYVDLTIPAATTLTDIGLEEGSLYIREVKENTVAAKKGILKGDKIVSINGVVIDHWIGFRKQIQDSQGKALEVGLLREGEPVIVKITPEEVTHQDKITFEKRKQLQLGVISCMVPGDPAYKVERYLNPFVALYHGVGETMDIAFGTLKGLGKLVSGQLSVNTLGGPISIFYLAGTSYKMGGWEAFFRMMAVLSITLAVLNFLPIPVLDGGHLFFFLIEAVKGSPVSLRIQQWGQQIGLVLILGLMVITFYVDINRFFVDKIKMMFQ